jgi:hypothetical protein
MASNQLYIARGGGGGREHRRFDIYFMEATFAVRQTERSVLGLPHVVDILARTVFF